MTALILSCLWFALVAWLIWHALRQRHAFRVVDPDKCKHDSTSAVCVIVPARDEGGNIANCVNSLLGQRLVDLRVIVVDDESSDDTAAIVAAMAENDPRVTLIEAQPLPPGWKGKVHACCSGLAAASAGIEWLCFMDADVTAHPAAIASAVASAEESGLDLLSLMPRQDLQSFAERLIMPCGLYLLAFSQNVSRVQAPGSDEVAATGQFMLFRRTAYEAVGGHAAVRNEICEDAQLARLMKHHGKHVLMLDGAKVLTARMYTGWDTLLPGLAKNLSFMLGGPARMVAVGLAAFALAWAAVLVPALDIVLCADGSQAACAATAPAFAGSLAAFALHIAGALHFGIPAWYGLLFPFGYSAGAVIGIDSLRWKWKRRVRWKGRVYQ